MKCLAGIDAPEKQQGRSRKGAWIEMVLRFLLLFYYLDGRSRKGAWIEIEFKDFTIEKFSCRSRKGAWIEITPQGRFVTTLLSLPQGSVD